MTILVQQQLRAAAQEVSPWSGSLTHTWKSQAEDYTWIVGHVDEDGVPYTVARVEADAYDYQGVSEKLAEFFRLANPAAVLALLDELDQLKAENAELRRDAERYRWVRQPVNGNKVFAMAGNGECGGNMDSAIDQAMTKEQP